MFQEVKLYAAAFRKHGLQKGDRVACYMSNRKEAIFAFLATTSIGAIWGGPQPFYGERAATNIVSKLEAKFLIEWTDSDNGEEYQMFAINYLHFIYYIIILCERFLTDCPSLERIIIVPTVSETLARDISHIPNSCFLVSFLESGKSSNGEVPDIVFEQLPFNHPISVSFTSGTTGLPKGPVHAAGSLLGTLTHFALHWDLKSGDTVHSFYPMGWGVWNYFVACMSLGVKLLLHSGFPYGMKDGYNVWDVISEYKVSFIFLVTSLVDKLEKIKAAPRPSNTNFEHLKAIALGGCAVKVQNYKYIQSIVKDDVLISCLYGATENYYPSLEKIITCLFMLLKLRCPR
ncbi:Acetoacetyl-CoA synthetase like protein [Argiope bruennichi]|nr:Acetoacetyl-CoA synthetase like protein [Argiope bruennichi]